MFDTFAHWSAVRRERKASGESDALLKTERQGAQPRAQATYLKAKCE